MFVFNTKTRVDRTFKMSELGKLFKVDAVMKEEAKSIDKVVLEQVLSQDTLNMKSSEACQEIYVFGIYIKEREVPIHWIKALDQITSPHTYFVMYFRNEVKELCIYRQVEQDTIKRCKTYETPWKLEGDQDLPYCKQLVDVYEALVTSLIPLCRQKGETTQQVLQRYEEVQKLDKQIKGLEQKINCEKQPKKKFELARQLRVLQGDYNKKRGMHDE